jgi:hypothetical protein
MLFVIVREILAEISRIPLFDHVPLYRLPDAVLYETADHTSFALPVGADSAKVVKICQHDWPQPDRDRRVRHDGES